MTSSPTSAQASTSFFKEEFERALSEQSFGISSYELSSSSSLDANATIELLEKTKVVVNLSIRGYKIMNDEENVIVSSGQHHNETIFESLESLLLHASPVFAVKRTELLLSKLAS